MPDLGLHCYQFVRGLMQLGARSQGSTFDDARGEEEAACARIRLWMVTEAHMEVALKLHRPVDGVGGGRDEGRGGRVVNVRLAS